MKKIGVLTSGGDAPGMNAAIRAVVRKGIDLGLEVYGIQRGFEGLMEGEIEKMTLGSVADILQRGGTMLKTARSERFLTVEGREKAISVLSTFGIEGLVVIGGNGSLRGARDLARMGFPVVGIPGTIDNDLNYTDYTIGFDTAVNTVLDAITKVRDTSSSHERITIIEVMGRHCGDIALYAGLTGGAEVVLIPEKEVNPNDVAKKVIQDFNKGKLHSIIIMAEGYSMSPFELAEFLEERTGKETRPVVLSYLQRGGSPTMKDRLVASLAGAKAASLLKDDSYGKTIGVENGAIVVCDLEEALEMDRTFDEEMFDLIDVLSK
ncbi:MAG: 6-phosphofructokinase [Clostridia bacterium]|nr:6-phosphofructokinase [Clostridia bacterium]